MTLPLLPGTLLISAQNAGVLMPRASVPPSNFVVMRFIPAAKITSGGASCNRQ